MLSSVFYFRIIEHLWEKIKNFYVNIFHSRETTRPQSSWIEKIFHQNFVWLQWTNTWTLLTCCVGTLTRISLSWLRYNEKLEFSKDQSLQQLCATNQNVHWQCVTPWVLRYHSTNDAVDSWHQYEQKPFTGASHFGVKSFHKQRKVRHISDWSKLAGNGDSKDPSPSTALHPPSPPHCMPLECQKFVLNFVPKEDWNKTSSTLPTKQNWPLPNHWERSLCFWN